MATAREIVWKNDLPEACFWERLSSLTRHPRLVSYLRKVLLSCNRRPKTRFTDVHYKQMTWVMERRPRYGSQYNHLRVALIHTGLMPAHAAPGRGQLMCSNGRRSSGEDK